jgi:hypothetical protein
MSTLLHAIVYVFTQFAECTSTDSKYNGIGKKSLTETLSTLRERIRAISLIEHFSLSNFYIKPRCHFVSKVFSTSKNTAAVEILLFTFNATWSVSLMHLSAMP